MKIGVVSLGCPKNMVDTEYMLGNIVQNGHSIENNPADCDVIIVNTCGFIDDAKQESINTILEMADYKDDKCISLIVTGCLGQRYKDEIMKEIPEVDAVLGTNDYDSLIDVINNTQMGSKIVLCSTKETINNKETIRINTNDGVYAYIKIADGCDNRCSYCIIPEIRGKYRSRTIESIEREALKLVNDGKTEIILIAQDVTGYGKDIYGEKKLSELINTLCKINNLMRLRVLYTYPDEIDEKLISTIKSNKKVCRYFDIPIQHISDVVLTKMGRRSSSKGIKDIINRLREEIPEIVIRTSLIVGFPGESEEDFNELCSFISEYRLDRLGVFKYSQEEGTKAANFGNQIDDNVKEDRYNMIMELQRKISSEKNKKSLGEILKVAVEGIAEDGIFYFGRSEFDTPEIDGVIYFTSEEPIELNSYVNVKILDCDEYDLTGEVIYEFAK